MTDNNSRQEQVEDLRAFEEAEAAFEARCAEQRKAEERADNDIDAYDVQCFIGSRTDVTPAMVAEHFGIALGEAQWMMV